MSEKTFINTRIGLKYDTYANWAAVASTFKPLKGEVIVFEIPASAGSGLNEPSIIFKIGDGTNFLADLPFASAKAADVNTYALMSASAFENTIKDWIEEYGTDTNTTYKLELEGSVLKFYKHEKDEASGTWTQVGQDIPVGTPGAMHFIAVLDSTAETFAAALAAYKASHTSYVEASGDVMSWKVKEYVYNGSQWQELGDETRYAVKGEIVNSDIAANAAISQTKIDGLVSALNAKAEINDLADIAFSGSVADLIQPNDLEIVFNCGGAPA